jgi:hypothetical protein
MAAEEQEAFARKPVGFGADNAGQDRFSRDRNDSPRHFQNLRRSRTNGQFQAPQLFRQQGIDSLSYPYLHPSLNVKPEFPVDGFRGRRIRLRMADYVCIETFYTQAMVPMGWLYARLRPNPGWAFKALPAPMLPVPGTFTPSSSPQQASRDAEAWALTNGYRLGGAWGCPKLDGEGSDEDSSQGLGSAGPL